MHYGPKVTDLNKDYVVPNGYLLEVRADVKRQCKLCGNTPNAAAAAPSPRRLEEVRARLERAATTVLTGSTIGAQQCHFWAQLFCGVMGLLS